MTETSTEGTARHTGDPAIAHWVCGICNLDPGPGDIAICGHVTKGVIPHGASVQKCVMCEDLQVPHYWSHT